MMLEEVCLINDDIIIADFLINLLKETDGKVLLTYGRLAKLMNEKSVKCNAHFIFKNLDRINRWCLTKKAPMISVIIIHQDTGRPEKGFFDLYRSKNPKHACKNDNEIFISAWRSVREFKKWDNVINELKQY